MPDFRPLLDAMRGYVARATDPLRLRVEAVEKRIETLPLARDGAPGRDGTPGRDGSPGMPGERGEKGERGEPGVAGDRGERGTDGAPGPQGEPGARGEPGVRGEQGPPGEKGATGDSGPTGERGERGPAGEKGERGERGEQGPPGAIGERGPAGEKGERGEKGDAGARGERGETGERGEAGAAGKDGAQGREGAAGRDGVSIIATTVAEDGALVVSYSDGHVERAGNVRGRDGIRGEKGDRGERGERGESGRDALELRPMHAIDVARGYPAGTWACHRGGLFLAERQTEPLEIGGTMAERGWRCIINGEHQLDIDLGTDGRTWTVRRMRSAGEIEERSFRVPAVIYRGVYTDAERDNYLKGDSVTRDGSLWIAMVDKPRNVPGEGADWRLAAKRGRDGK